MASKNITVIVPIGTTYYPDPSQVCLPPTVADIIAFFAANYVAYAATVRSNPSEDPPKRFICGFFCLFFPAFGLSIAMQMVVSCAACAGWFGDEKQESLIRKATLAGALVMVVRNTDKGKGEWQPKHGDEIHYALLHSPMGPKPSALRTCLAGFRY
jgi:hypothetical protein